MCVASKPTWARRRAAELGPPPAVRLMFFVVLFLFAALASTAAAQQRTLTLEEAIALAQNQGAAAKAAVSARDAERWRDRAFSARRLPQLSLEGTVPDINRGISPVFRDDGTTAFVTQREMQSELNLTLSQQVTPTGGTPGRCRG